jgi:hypothetical protein
MKNMNFLRKLLFLFRSQRQHNSGLTYLGSLYVKHDDGRIKQR